MYRYTLCICIYIKNVIYFWVNYNISLTWIKAIWGWFPLLTMIPVRSQWGRYNLPRYMRMWHRYLWKKIASTLQIPKATNSAMALCIAALFFNAMDSLAPEDTRGTHQFFFVCSIRFSLEGSTAPNFGGWRTFLVDFIRKDKRSCHLCRIFLFPCSTRTLQRGWRWPLGD